MTPRSLARWSVAAVLGAALLTPLPAHADPTAAPTAAGTVSPAAAPRAGAEVPAPGQSRLQIETSTDHTVDGDRDKDKFTIIGRLVDHDGPLAGQPVTLYADRNPTTWTTPALHGDEAQTLTTDASGTVVFTRRNYYSPTGYALRYAGTEGIAGSDSATVVVAVLVPTEIIRGPLVPVADGYQLRGRVSIYNDFIQVPSPTVEVWTSPDQQSWTRSQVVTGDNGGRVVNGEPELPGFTLTIPKTQGGYLQIRYLGGKQVSGSPGLWLGPATSSTVTLPAPAVSKTAVELAVPDPIRYADQVSATATVTWADQPTQPTEPTEPTEPTQVAAGVTVAFTVRGRDGQVKEGTAVTGSDGVARFGFTATASSTVTATVAAGQQVGGRSTGASTVSLDRVVTRNTALDIHAKRRLAEKKSGTLTGNLTWARTDTAVAGQPVQLWSRTRHHTWRHLDTAATDDTGRVTFTVRQKRTTDYRLRYRGSKDPTLDTAANPTRSKVTVVHTSHRSERR